MPGPFDPTTWLFAQAVAQAPAAGTAKPPAGGGEPTPEANPLISLLPFLPMLILGYLLILRPQQRQERARREMLSALKRNDRVVTSGGIYGTVVSLDAEHDKAVLRVDDEKGVRLTVSRASIVRVETDREKEKSAAGAASS
jgi:preprotein translocase subunit YajC